MHASVLLQEAVVSLGVKPGSTVIDGTLGSGGHARQICDQVGPSGTLIGLDLDTESIARSKELLADSECVIKFHEANFKDLDQVLKTEGVEHVDAILLDLGWSMDQFETSGRGFSFRRDEPLSMMLKASKSEAEFDAADILNTWKEEDIANILYGYGEERFARRIAREIVERRDEHPLKTTTDLVDVIMSSVPAFYRHGRIHPATRTFQALRIAVNDELRSLSEVLVKGFTALRPGGRMAVITFHSLEDRIVKNFFRERVIADEGELMTKKPVIPTDEELMANPRSRSAKLRVIKKL